MTGVYRTESSLMIGYFRILKSLFEFGILCLSVLQIEESKVTSKGLMKATCLIQTPWG